MGLNTWTRAEPTDDPCWNYRSSSYSGIPLRHRECGRRKKDGLFFQANAEEKDKAIELLNTFGNCDCTDEVVCSTHTEMFKDE